MCVHLIFSGGQGRALAQNAIKVRCTTIANLVPLEVQRRRTDFVRENRRTDFVRDKQTTANTILVGVPPFPRSARATV